jgi:putative PIN family toxin of toxin-antitoxin system
MKPIKTVFDTNVYLAASKKSSYARVHLQRARPNGPYRLYISPEIILEIRNKLEIKFGYTPEESGRFIEMILLYATLVQPKQRISGVLKDADDHIILECALEADAKMIVSADKGLLKLKEFRGITIIHPTMLQYMFPQS